MFTAMLDRVAEVVKACRFRFADENQLQQALAGALSESGFDVQREVRLNSRDRIDLLVDRTGIEVKVAGSLEAVWSQMERYSLSEQIDDLILVTTRVRHQLPSRMNNKPIVVVSLAAAGL